MLIELPVRQVDGERRAIDSSCAKEREEPLVTEQLQSAAASPLASS